MILLISILTVIVIALVVITMEHRRILKMQLKINTVLRDRIKNIEDILGV